MEFVKNKIDYSEDGQEIITEVSYIATLENGLAEILLVTDTEQIPIRTQPWKPNSDGSRSNWTNVNEVVEWFKDTD